MASALETQALHADQRAENSINNLS